jgi:CHAT domain-containing protein
MIAKGMNLVRYPLLDAEFVELAESEKETDILSQLLKSKDYKVKLLMRENAIEESVKALPSSEILHFSCHGLIQPLTMDSLTMNVNRMDPMLRSALVLAGVSSPYSKIDDGLLTAYEVVNLKLENTDLVVLSACESGNGELSYEGVYGLQRAFKIAGAKRIVMSLWKVDEEGSAKFMDLFYTELLDGGDVLSAFNKAQSKLREIPDFQDPYIWGAFILVGI